MWWFVRCGNLKPHRMFSLNMTSNLLLIEHGLPLYVEEPIVQTKSILVVVLLTAALTGCHVVVRLGNRWGRNPPQ